MKYLKNSHKWWIKSDLFAFMAHFWALLALGLKERCPKWKRDLATDFCPSPAFGNLWTEGSCSCFRCCFSWILRFFLDSHQKQNKKIKWSSAMPFIAATFSLHCTKSNTNFGLYLSWLTCHKRKQEMEHLSWNYAHWEAAPGQAAVSPQLETVWV